MIASSHITLSDLNDPIQQDTAPPSAAEGALWLDTSQSPPVLKRFDGDDWEAVQDEEWLERKLSSVYAQISTETDAIRQELAQELKNGLEIRPSKKVGAGFRLAAKDGSGYFDCSDEEIAEMLMPFFRDTRL